MTLPDLIEALQAAEGPSRELDARIYEAATIILGNGHPDATIQEDGSGVLVAIRHDGWPWVPTADEPDPGSWHGVGFAPNFTASLDAAIGLVERLLPGWRIEMRIGDWPASDPRRVTLWNNDTTKRTSVFGISADHATPAVALCIAALRCLEGIDQNG